VPLRFRIRPPAHAGGLTGVERTVDVEPSAGSITIGRRVGVAVQLPYGTVSALHARVAGSPGRWTIEDLGSANGTFVIGARGDARRLDPGELHPLVEGDQIRLAEVALVFEGNVGGRQAGAITESTATLARRLVSDFFGACRPAEVARVVVEDGPDSGRAVSLGTVGRSYRVGRSADCDLVLTDDDVSREHAAFERRWDGVEVRDLGSKNGVVFDGDRLVEPRRLHDGDEVLLGQTRLRLEDPEDRYLRQMEDEDGGSTAAGPPPERAHRQATEPSRVERRAARGRVGRGPVLIAGLAVLVLAGIAAVVAWFLLGDWQ
jgi:pSer/pThr/pTyr-binding forkhead associated (FHA) protein